VYGSHNCYDTRLVQSAAAVPIFFSPNYTST